MAVDGPGNILVELRMRMRGEHANSSLENWSFLFLSQYKLIILFGPAYT